MLTSKDAHLVLENFGIKAFLDTNILVYLVDDLYSSLDETISILDKNIYVSLISSSFVVFEFIGVRKKEHFLRKVLQNNFSRDAEGKFDISKINLLSVLKYNDSYESDSQSYEDIKGEIESCVESDLRKLSDNLKIDYEKNTLHDKLFEPTKKLFLVSRISKEDCLVISSAVWPDSMSQNNNILFFSNDKDFVSRLRGADVATFFLDNSAVVPRPIYLRGSEGTKDLTKKHDSVELGANIKSMISLLIKDNNDKYYIGKTVQPPKKYPSLVAFSMQKGKSVPKDVVLVIVSRDLEFFYVSSGIIASFQDQGTDVWPPFSACADVLLSFSLDIESDSDLDTIHGEKRGIDLLREGGHAVFIHPDSFIES